MYGIWLLSLRFPRVSARRYLARGHESVPTTAAVTGVSPNRRHQRQGLEGVACALPAASVIAVPWPQPIESARKRHVATVRAPTRAVKLDAYAPPKRGRRPVSEADAIAARVQELRVQARELTR